MILIDCPACTATVTSALPLPETLRCNDCAVAWDVTDSESDSSEARLAA